MKTKTKTELYVCVYNIGKVEVWGMTAINKKINDCYMRACVVRVYIILYTEWISISVHLCTPPVVAYTIWPIYCVECGISQ